MNVNDRIHGFLVTKATPVSEVEGTLYEMVFEKNGAKLAYLDRSDDNKSFAIAFKTLPEDDTGVFHIIEHSVLCGSKKYPVKEPFVELLKGSLNTFLNALTYPDKTVYPVASRNEQDFLNLMDVYLDAVLHPKAITDPSVFRQEGWHYDIEKPDTPPTYKGVVFNEMKGAFSSVDSVAGRMLTHLMFPDNCYGNESGGDPVSIPNLTYEQFVASHARYYHPSNARIFLDGTMDVDRVLAKIEEFLAPYDYLEIDSDIPMQKPRGEIKKTIEYEIAETEDPNGKVRLSLSFLGGSFDEREKQIALDAVCSYLAGSNESPLCQALVGAGLCEDASFYLDNGIQQYVLTLEVKNTTEEKLPAVKETFYRVIRETIANGFDKDRMTAIFNRAEFNAREHDTGHTPLGLVYGLSMYDTWLYGGAPAAPLSDPAFYPILREKLDTGYYGELLDEIILQSKHNVELVLLPSTTLGKKKLDDENARLAAARASWSDEECEKYIAENAALVQWQQTEDTEEQLATLPALKLSDITGAPADIPTEEIALDGTKVLYHDLPTNGITYATLYFDLAGLSGEELTSLSLLTGLIGTLPTASHDALTLQGLVKRDLGEFGVGITAEEGPDGAKVCFSARASALDSNKDRLVALVGEHLFETVYEDRKKIREQLRQLVLNLQQSYVQAGHSVALDRIAAHTTGAGAAAELTAGYEFYLAVKALEADFDAKIDGFLESARATLAGVLVRERLLVTYAGKRDDSFAKSLISLVKIGKKPTPVSNFAPLPRQNEAIVIPAQVAFAGLGNTYAALGKERTGALLVASSILTYGYLWNAVRVQGGAYGVGFLPRVPTVNFYSYRDPTPARTLGCYAESAAFLRQFAASGADLTRFIIGAVGRFDPLLTPRSAYDLADTRYFRGAPYEESVLRIFEEILATDNAALLEVADLLDKLANDAVTCVVGGKEKIDTLDPAPDVVLTV